MRALGFEPKKEEIRKMISDIDKDGSGKEISVKLALEGQIKDTFRSPHQRLYHIVSVISKLHYCVPVLCKICKICTKLMINNYIDIL